MFSCILPSNKLESKLSTRPRISKRLCGTFSPSLTFSITIFMVFFCNNNNIFFTRSTHLHDEVFWHRLKKDRKGGPRQISFFLSISFLSMMFKAPSMSLFWPLKAYLVYLCMYKRPILFNQGVEIGTNTKIPNLKHSKPWNLEVRTN